MTEFPCWYCKGARSPCTCIADCGARAQHPLDHVCPKAPREIRADWLRGTGYYTEEEIGRLTAGD